MKHKPTTSGLWQIFLGLPLSCGIVLTLMLGALSTTGPGLDFAESLQADVYPNPDEVPDGNLPTGELESEFLPAIIDILLALMSTVVLGVMLTSATLYIIHFGDEEQLKTAKGLWKWGIAGVIVMIVAYTSVEALTQLNFLRT